jgi:transcriptional regulator with XRE-family HTH domain
MPRSVFTDAYASLLQKLIAVRKRVGVTQVELARRLGKPQSFVSTIERGVRRLDVLEFYAIAHALGLEPVAMYAEIVAGLPQRVEV